MAGAGVSGFNPGQLAEDLHCNGFPPGRVLSPQERADIVEHAAWFEECAFGRAELERLSDADLVAACYHAMLDYVRDQL